MIGWRIGFLAARLVAGAFAIVTATYCLLAYLPFTYHQVHLGALLPWLSTFARFHPYLYWPAFAAAVMTLPSLRNDRTRSLTLLFVLTYGVAGVRLISSPLLARLGNDSWDLVWCLAALTPLMWMAGLDWLAQHEQVHWALPNSAETGRLFGACVSSAACVWLLTTTLAVLRYGILSDAGLTGRQWTAAVLWSLFSYLATVMAVFLLLNLAATLARCVARGRGVHALFYLGAMIAVAAAVFRFVVFAPLSFSGPAADLIALAMACSTVAFASGASVRLYRAGDGALETPLELLLIPARSFGRISRPLQVLVLVAGCLSVAGALIHTSKFDWGYLLQTLIVICAWIGAFALFYTIGSPFRWEGRDGFVLAAAALVCIYLGLTAWPLRNATQRFSPWLDRYSEYDVGFRLTRAALAPPVKDVAADSLYSFLTRNTNIPRSVRTAPVEINLSGKLVPTPGPKPNIFIFVIDSLRRDYLSPYNPAVNFTPAVDAFARESFIARNAFTRYAGTGLSEPSIWAGGMLLHKQYVTPFYSMNALQKLLDFEGYRQFITEDEILNVILAPSPLIEPLDAGRPTMSCELCRSLAELQSKISAAPPDRPIFAYTQPQNIHVSVINREGRSVPPGEDYPGFDSAYAARVRTMDRCFGQFIQYLKSAGLYERSIVVLTSDHGDSLGERGRWGHAYNVVPEVVRVPLIIHLPAAIPPLASDADAPAFLVDITPSLYYLLGHRPIERNDIFGKPLFTATAQESAAYARDSYLIASSYGPVYAILSNRGHALYVADGVDYKDYFYDLEQPSQPGLISAEMRAERQELIRDYVTGIDRFYRFNTEEELSRK